MKGGAAMTRRSWPDRSERKNPNLFPLSSWKFLLLSFLSYDINLKSHVYERRNQERKFWKKIWRIISGTIPSVILSILLLFRREISFGIPSRSKGRNETLSCQLLGMVATWLKSTATPWWAGKGSGCAQARHNARNRMGVQRRKGRTTIYSN